MRWTRVKPVRFILIIAVTVMAFILCYAWANFNNYRSYFNSPQVLAFSATAPANSYLEPVGGIDLNQLLEQTNQERTMLGLPALIADEGLYKSAQAKCRDMTAKHYWSHYAPDGTSGLSFISRNYPNYYKIGENLANGYTNSTEVMAGWMQSAPHRSAIMNRDYQYVGFSVCQGDVGYGSDNLTIVQHFLASTP